MIFKNMDIFKICAAAILVLFVLIIMRELKSPVAPALKAAAVLLFGGALILDYLPLYKEVVEMASGTALADYMPVLIRALGVSVIVRICSDVCREGGEGGLAFCIETVGRLEILMIALPLVKELMANVNGLLEL